MDIKAEIRNQFLSEIDRSSSETRRTRLFWCDKFLAFAPDDLSKWDKNLVLNFISKLEKKDYAALTIRTAFGVAKRVFDAAKIVNERRRTQLISSIDVNDPSAVAEVLKAMALPGPVWDVGKRVMPQADVISKPAFSFDEIQRIVDIAKNSELAPHLIAFTALASVYGLRQGELQAVRLEDIDYKRQTIFIRTEKGGVRRDQLLAPEIIPWLQKYNFRWEFSQWRMNEAFKQVMDKAGIKDRQGGWHRFRRFLDGALRDALASDPNVRKDYEIIVKVYFRWALGRSSDMSIHYYPQHPLEADQMCLEHNPVVPLWA